MIDFVRRLNDCQVGGQRQTPEADRGRRGKRVINSSLTPLTRMTLHKYLYAGQDPVNKTDPSGYSSLGSLSISLSNSIDLQVAKIGVQFATSRAAWGLLCVR